MKRIDTLRQDDKTLTAILDTRDRDDQRGGARGSPEPSFRYRVRGLNIQLQQPGSSSATAHLAPTRTLSSTRLVFLHGCYLHPGTHCRVQLITMHGTWEDIDARVVQSQYVNGVVYEILAQFIKPIDVSLYCADASTCRVLLIEPDAIIARVIERHLARLNCAVEHVADPAAGVALAAEKAFDLIVLAMQLGEQDGFETTHRVRENGYSGPIVAVTANGDTDERSRCLESGCDEVVTKPIESEALAQMVRTFREEPIYSTMQEEADMAGLITEFVANLSEPARAIQDALSRADTAKLEQIARSLKSHGSSFGFDVISAAAGALEEALHSGTPLESLLDETQNLIRICRRCRSHAASATPDAHGGASA